MARSSQYEQLLVDGDAWTDVDWAETIRWLHNEPYRVMPKLTAVFVGLLGEHLRYACGHITPQQTLSRLPSHTYRFTDFIPNTALQPWRPNRRRFIEGPLMDILHGLLQAVPVTEEQLQTQRACLESAIGYLCWEFAPDPDLMDRLSLALSMVLSQEHPYYVETPYLLPRGEGPKAANGWVEYWDPVRAVWQVGELAERKVTSLGPAEDSGHVLKPLLDYWSSPAMSADLSPAEIRPLHTFTVRTVQELEEQRELIELEDGIIAVTSGRHEFEQALVLASHARWKQRITVGSQIEGIGFGRPILASSMTASYQLIERSFTFRVDSDVTAGGYDHTTGVSRRFYKMGEWRRALDGSYQVDALDTNMRWFPARVFGTTRSNAVRVAYNGWDSRHNEWIERYSARLARSGTWMPLYDLSMTAEWYEKKDDPEFAFAAHRQLPDAELQRFNKTVWSNRLDTKWMDSVESPPSVLFPERRPAKEGAVGRKPPAGPHYVEALNAVGRCWGWITLFRRPRFQDLSTYGWLVRLEMFHRVCSHLSYPFARFFIPHLLEGWSSTFVQLRLSSEQFRTAMMAMRDIQHSVDPKERLTEMSRTVYATALGHCLNPYLPLVLQRIIIAYSFRPWKEELLNCPNCTFENHAPNWTKCPMCGTTSTNV
jgi:hypothetical protein